jgi:hypothetical protein
MKRSNYDPLLKGILADESLETLRRRSLAHGQAITRRRRYRAVWAKACLFSAISLGALGLLLSVASRSRTGSPVVRGPAPTNALTLAKTTTTSLKQPADVRFISDDELLALFPGRPLALVGPPGQKTLLFLDQSPTDKPSETSQPDY